MRKNFIFLTGGLGNQIFQIAAAASFSHGRELIVKSWGNPAAIDGLPEAAKLQWPATVRFEKIESKKISRLISLLLRKGVEAKKTESNVETIVTRIIEVLLFLELRTPPTVVLNRGIGYSQLSDKGNRSKFFIGYFQTHVFYEQIVGQYDLKLIPEVQISEECEQELIGVHVRLGDYLKEQEFGIPGEDYYLQSLALIPNGENKLIKLFTNSPELVQEYFPNLPWHRISIYNDVESNSIDTLKAMMNCDFLIIGNSTYSWWAAFLSTKTKLVTYPHPWFKGIPEPLKLFPPSWKPINSKFEQARKLNEKQK